MKTFRCSNGTLVGINPTQTRNYRVTGAIAQKEGGFSMKKAISLILALVCALSLVSVSALADGIDAQEMMTIIVNGNVITGTSDFLMAYLASMEGNTGAVDVVADTTTTPATLPNWTAGGNWTLGEMFQNVDPDPHFLDLNDLGLQTNNQGVKYALANVHAGNVVKISGSHVELFVNGEHKGSTLPGGEEEKNTLMFIYIPEDCQLELLFSKGWIPSVQVFDGLPYVWEEYKDLAITQLTDVVPHLVDHPYAEVDCRFCVLGGENTDVVYTMGSDGTLITTDVNVPDVG